MAKKKRDVEKPVEDNGDKPWVSNYPPLKNWLDKHEARCMWQWPCGDKPSDPDEAYGWTPPAYVECWLVGKSSVILVVHGGKRGWEIYSAINSPLIEQSLIDAEKRCGIERAEIVEEPREPVAVLPRDQSRSGEE